MSFSSVVLGLSPAMWIRLGDTSGTTATDASGNGRDGTYSGCTLNQTGILPADASAKSTLFSKASFSRALVPYGSWMNGGSGTALSVWVRMKCPDYTAEQHMGDRDLGGQRAFIFRVISNKLDFYKNPGSGSEVRAVGLTTLTDGVEYDFGFTYDGAKIRLYLNGVIDNGTGTTAAGTINPTSTSDLSIGASRLGGGGFAGLTDGNEQEYIYFNSVLSDADMLALHTAAVTAAVDQNVTAPTATSTATGIVPVVSAGSSLIVPTAATATAAGIAPAVAGTGDGAVIAPTATAAAAGLVPVVSADSALVAPVAAASAAGLTPTIGATSGVVAPTAAATADGIAPFVDDGSGSQTVIAPPATANAAGIAPTITVIVDSPTDTSNALDGRTRDGFSSVELIAPVVVPTTPLATRVEKSVPLPMPALVNGRPT